MSLNNSITSRNNRYGVKPLGFVPLGPVLPGFAVLLFGLGLTARDGLVILFAGLSLVAATFVLVRVWNRISNVAEAFLG